MKITERGQIFGYSIVAVVLIIGILSLHIWAWQESPSGMFVNGHARMSSGRFSGQTP